MRQRIIAISAVLMSLAVGSLALFDWETATVVRAFDSDWEFIDKDKCDLSPCNAQACIAAQNHINDAGFPCLVRFAECEMRINQRLRGAAAANGLTLGPKRYQQLKFPIERCIVPAKCSTTPDGGFTEDGGCPGRVLPGGPTFGLALDDAGWPMMGNVSVATPPCVRAPLDGGLNCQRGLPDGGSRFFGTGNVFPVAQAVGAQCEPVACAVFFGDNPDTDL